MTKVYTVSYELCAGEKKYKKEHELGLSLLQNGMKELYGIALEIEELSAEIEIGLHGKPHFKIHKDIHFNISHTDGLVACALSDASVGIDVEIMRQFKNSIIKRVLTEKEREILLQYRNHSEKYMEQFYRFWTLKESYLKWEGSGFHKDPRSLSFELDPGDDTTWRLSSDHTVRFRQEVLDQKYILTICDKNQ